ncbi:MAG: hypothetical protein ACO1N0_11070 [Fluviicola sp.]
MACSSPAGKQTKDNSKDSLVAASDTTDYEIKTTLKAADEREYMDSANFHIIRGNYASGNKFMEVYENRLTKLDNWKEYYENGQLKCQGVMTTGNHIYVGIWKYYSPSGKIDSIVDHDKKYPVSYSSALRIAAKKGFKMPDMEVELQVDGSKTFWEVQRWTENENQDGQSAEIILINTRSGKVTKPEYQVVSVY